MKKRVLTIAIIAAIFLAFVPTVSGPANAASEKCWNIYGTTEGTTTFTVTITPKTYGKDYVTLKHVIGKQYYHYKKADPIVKHYWGECYAQSYGYYKITIKEGNRVINTVNWNGTKDIKLTFGTFFKYKVAHFATKTYTVSVAPARPFADTASKKFIHWSGSKCSGRGEAFPKKTPNKWRVYTTSSGVKSCGK